MQKPMPKTKTILTALNRAGHLPARAGSENVMTRTIQYQAMDGIWRNLEVADIIDPCPLDVVALSLLEGCKLALIAIPNSLENTETRKYIKAAIAKAEVKP